MFERARLGMTLAWQEPARFEGITVAQYLEVSNRTSIPGRISGAWDSLLKLMENDGSIHH